MDEELWALAEVIYDRSMSRIANLGLVTVLTAAFGAAGVLGAVGAQAQPPRPAPPCTYTLSPPHVDGGRVTATVTFDSCAGPFRPAMSVACVYANGDQSRGQCAQARGSAVAQVFFEPYQPGASYRSTGRGYGTIFTDMLDPNCDVLGPIDATL